MGFGFGLMFYVRSRFNSNFVECLQKYQGNWQFRWKRCFLKLNHELQVLRLIHLGHQLTLRVKEKKWLKSWEEMVILAFIDKIFKIFLLSLSKSFFKCDNNFGWQLIQNINFCYEILCHTREYQDGLTWTKNASAWAFYKDFVKKSLIIWLIGLWFSRRRLPL